MKLVALEGGRLLDLVAIEEFRPAAGLYWPDLIQAMIDRYKFGIGPKELTEAIKSGVKFEHGKLVSDDDTKLIKEFSIYTDGLIVETSDTDTADLVLDDFFAWATNTFKLRERQNQVQRTYTSAVIIEFAKEIEPALGKLEKVVGMLSAALKDSYGWDYKYNVSRLAYSVDPEEIPHLRNTQFVLERRINVNYSENRYYSIAPIRTRDHLKLLTAIETELLSNPS